MEHFHKAVDDITRRATESVKQVDIEQADRLIDFLIDARSNNRKIMITGVGRSGLVGRAFAMRLMHLNFDVHVIGETVTPPLEKDDVLLAISGSGKTDVIVTTAKNAKDIGARTVVLTSYPTSPLAVAADHSVIIRGRTKIGENPVSNQPIPSVNKPLAPLGTMFEIASTIFLDSLIVELMNRLSKTEQEMKSRHATVE